MSIRYFFIFYGRTLRITLPVAIGITLLAKTTPLLIEDALRIGLKWFPTFALAVDACYRILFKKKEFYFYRNGSWTVAGLYTGAFIFSVFISVVLHFTFKMMMRWY